MTKTHVSFAALSFLMAACSAAALPSAVTPAAAAAPASQSTPTPPTQPAPIAVAETSVAAPMHVAPRDAVAAPRASLRDAVTCEVRVRPTSNGMLIQAVAHANGAIDGEYELVITRSGGSGSSDVTQGGPFSAAAGENITLGSTELGADGRYRAVLVMRNASGEICRQERRS